MLVEEKPAPPIDLLNLSSSAAQPEPPAKSQPLPRQPSFDLLGGFGTSEPQNSAVTPDLLSDSKPKASALDDLFGAFAPTNGASAGTASSAGLDFASAPKPPTMNFDPFGLGLGGGEPSFMSGADLLQPNKDASPAQPHQPQQQTKAADQNGARDPFADMSSLASGLNLNWGDKGKTAASGNNGTPMPAKSPQSTQYTSPTHQFGGFAPASATAATQARSPMDGQRPDYSRSHFEQKAKPSDATSPNVGGGTAAGAGDIFADILGQQGYNFATKPQNASRSINAMRKEELIKDMDPDKLRIMEWVNIA